ncbi:MAG: hypothetical protein ACK5IJ_09210 [Mangrovibacterium sp.]
MKYDWKITSLLLFICITLVACSGNSATSTDDDDDNSGTGGGATTKNEVTIRNTTKALTAGFIEDYGQIAQGVYDIDFTAISATSSTNSPNEAIVYFDLYSSTPGKLTEGEYLIGTYNDAIAGKSNIFGDFSDAAIGDDINTNSVANTYGIINGSIITPTSGKFIVKESGDNYEVSFSGRGISTFYVDGEVSETLNEISLVFTYKGSVSKYDGEYVSTLEKSSKSQKKRHSF